MKPRINFLAMLLVGFTAIAVQAQVAGSCENATAQAAVNSRSSARHASADVSSQMQAMIGAAYAPFFNVAPKDAAS